MVTHRDWLAAIPLVHHHYYIGASVMIGLFFVGTSLPLSVKLIFGAGIYLALFSVYFLLRVHEFRDSFVGNIERLETFRSLDTRQREQFLKEFLAG